MAEVPLAFGIAANVIQFVDFAFKVLHTGHQMYKFQRNSTQENRELEYIGADLKNVAEGLDASLRDAQLHQNLSPDESQLRQLAEHCKTVCVELLEALEKLRGSGQPRRWRTLLAALKSISRLEDQQAPSAAYRNNDDLNSQGLGERFLHYIDQFQQMQNGFLQGCRDWQADLVEAIHQGRRSLQDQASALSRQSTGRKEQTAIKLLDSLYFPEIRDHQDRISEAHEKTFQWIYGETRPGERSWTHFVDWLEGDSTLYWVTGKAGSGKSTLMKYLCRDGRTIEHLRHWATEASLVMAAFFFWNSGTNLQMSQDGLLRSLSFQILEEDRFLIPRILNERWEVYELFSHDDSPWTYDELRRSFRLFANLDIPDTKFCIFIDGLDEFDGDHSYLIGFLKDIASSTHIKICVSSRPWVVFEDALIHKPNLMLQDLTYFDIKNVIDYRFREHPGFAELEKREPQYAEGLLEAIAQKAAGVFLWVHLVVQSLLAGFVNGDRVSDLQRRLNSLPPDLEDLYEKMLNSLDPFYFEHVAQFFQMVKAAIDPLTLLDLSFADEEPDFVFNCNMQFSKTDVGKLRADIMRQRINSCCKGLLEVGSNDTNYGNAIQSIGQSNHSSSPTLENWTKAREPSPHSTVQYLHRTVKDFLELPKIWSQFLAATQNEYDPNLALCRSFVVQLKLDSLESLSGRSHKETIIWSLRYAHIVQEDDYEGKRLETLTRLLDELDYTASGIVNAPSNIDSLANREQCSITIENSVKPQQVNWIHEYFWTSSISHQGQNRERDQSFVALAVSLDLYSYVKTKVKGSCLVVESTGVWPLLADAVAAPDHTKSGCFPWCLPSINMIKWLLEQGADPNWRISPTETPWTLMLDNIDECVRQGKSWQLNSWLDAVSLFLQHGADPTVNIGILLQRPDFPEREEKFKRILQMVRTPRSYRLLGTNTNVLTRLGLISPN